MLLHVSQRCIDTNVTSCLSVCTLEMGAPRNVNIMTKFIRIVVIDDHALIRHALRSLIAARADLELVAEGASGEELLSIVAAHQPDVVILDLNMPQSTVKSGAPESFMALQELTRLHRDYPETAVIILSEHLVPSLVQQALQVGVRGYILKSDDLSMNLPENDSYVPRKRCLPLIRGSARTFW